MSGREFSSHRDLAQATQAIVAGRPKRMPGAPLNEPPELATNYVSGSSRVYARGEGSRSWSAFEEAVGVMEGGLAIAYATGMAAAAAVADLVPCGGWVAFAGETHPAIQDLMEARQRLGQLNVVSIRSLSPGHAARGEGAVWVETPSNPSLELHDIKAESRFAISLGAMTVVDSTLASPVLQNALDLGADVVLHSASKIIGGHSDALLGVVVTRDDAIASQLRLSRSRNGATPGALECFLALRGLRTLPLRMRFAGENATSLARRLDAHRQVDQVMYPGLRSHTENALAQRQMRGYGNVLSFNLADLSAPHRLIEALQIIVPASSLGGIESTISMRERHQRDPVLRLSVGCEDLEDLWGDLERALHAANRAR